MRSRALLCLTVGLGAAALRGGSAGVPGRGACACVLEGSILVEASDRTAFGLAALHLANPGPVDRVAQCRRLSPDGYLRFGQQPTQAILKEYWAAQTGDGTILARVEKCSGEDGPLVEVDLVTGHATPLPAFPGIVGYGPVPGMLLAVSPTGSVSVLDRATGAMLWSMAIGSTIWVSSDRTRCAAPEERATGGSGPAAVMQPRP